jgi:hypothetical protein
VLHQSNIVLIIGSAPNALSARVWDKKQFSHIVAINNAWQVRSDWDFLLHPEDFPAAHMPPSITQLQTVITAPNYVPVQNDFGGFVYAGGTMAFTSAYWVLGQLRPKVMAFIGCDMVYQTSGQSTHFYGTGRADPLRHDVSLQSLEAKSARLLYLAAQQDCRCVNLSPADESRLLFPRSNLAQLQLSLPELAGNNSEDYFDETYAALAQQRELDLGYHFASGRYWEHLELISASECAAIDALWLKTLISAGSQMDKLKADLQPQAISRAAL